MDAKDMEKKAKKKKKAKSNQTSVDFCIVGSDGAVKEVVKKNLNNMEEERGIEVQGIELEICMFDEYLPSKKAARQIAENEAMARSLQDELELESEHSSADQQEQRGTKRQEKGGKGKGVQYSDS